MQKKIKNIENVRTIYEYLFLKKFGKGKRFKVSFKRISAKKNI